ncbi:DUF5667 domain-containing protein [Chloroflexota bacterium]
MRKFEDILAECIDDIKAGKASVEDCLNRYPSTREQLEPLLRIALEIREPSDAKPSPSFKMKARVRLMYQIHGRQAETRWPWRSCHSQMKPVAYIKRFSMSMAGVILAIVLAVFGLGAGTAYASQASLPGDTLYPIKLATEQAGMMLMGDDVARVERALSLANKRVREMEALAEKGRPQDLDLAAEKYGYALNMTLAEVEQADGRGLATENITALVAEATARHLLMLDDVWDMVPDEAKTAIAHARNMSETGREHALAALAKNDTVGATEMNLAAMEGRLNRVRAKVQNTEAVQIALQQFEAMSEFGEEISQIAQGIGLNATEVEELVAEATSRHLGVLAEVYDEVSEQAQPAIERVMANLMIRHQRRVQELEQSGAKVPPSPAIPERIQERVEERVQEQEGLQEQQQEQQMEGITGGTISPGSGVSDGVHRGQ